MRENGGEGRFAEAGDEVRVCIHVRAKQSGHDKTAVDEGNVARVRSDEMVGGACNDKKSSNDDQRETMNKRCKGDSNAHTVNGDV